MTWVGRAPGKVILLGEHAVVAGYPAIAAAVDRYTMVRLVERDGPAGLEEPYDDRVWPAIAPLVPRGIGVRIVSQLPIGAGMGSSAALAVALVRALASREGRQASFDECFERGFEVERAFHGTPSGIDHAVSACGGVVRFQKDRGVEPIASWPLRLVVADTGAPGNTAEMVARVKARGCHVELAAIGELVERAVPILEEDPIGIGPLFTQNQRLLRACGVSTERIDELCAVMEEAGAAGAKLAGAGGGGIVIAAVTDEAAATVLGAVEAVGVKAFSVVVGG